MTDDEDFQSFPLTSSISAEELDKFWGGQNEASSSMGRCSRQLMQNTCLRIRGDPGRLGRDKTPKISTSGEEAIIGALLAAFLNRSDAGHRD
jgi:hypothetical protein